MVIFDEGGHGGYLDGVGVVGRVLEEPVVRIEQFAGNEEEELSRGTSVVQSVLAVKGQKQFGALKILARFLHHLIESVLQQMVASVGRM